MILLMHPNTLPLFIERLNTFNKAKRQAGLPPIELGEASVRVDPHVAERLEDVQHWSPPAGDRFVEYERSDFAWLHPFGEGEFDLVIYAIDESRQLGQVGTFTMPRIEPSGPLFRI